MKRVRHHLSQVRLLGNVSFIALWIGSAVGHAWLLGSDWKQLSCWGVFSLLLAIVSSLAFAWISQGLMARPERLLIVAILVCLVHMPVDTAGASWEMLPAVALVIGLIAPLCFLTRFRIRPEALRLQFALIAADPIPIGRRIGIHLFSRPPPRS